MKRVLVSGGCGFIGSHLVRWLLREHSELHVVNIDLLTYAGLPNVQSSTSSPSVHSPIAFRGLLSRRVRFARIADRVDEVRKSRPSTRLRGAPVG